MDIKTHSHFLERRIYQPERTNYVLLLAHGAGAGNRHDFMHMLSRSLCEKNIKVISFNFPYMQRAYEQNKRRPPDKVDKLMEHFRQELSLIENEKLPIFIGGKSMGGRIASIVNGYYSHIKGTIVFGYPFIPPGKPQKFAERVSHFASLQSPLMILQGERDTFGDKNLLNKQSYPKSVNIEWIADGDHSFKPRKKSGLTVEQNLADAACKVEKFMNENV